MSLFRRRKSSREADLRVRARRARLAEREREAYERERSEGDGPGVDEQAPEAAAREPEPRSEPEPAAKPGPQPSAPQTQPSARRRAKPAPRSRRRLRRPKLGRGGRARLGGAAAGRSGAQATRSGARATVRQAQPGARRLGSGLGRVLGLALAWLLRLAGLVERGTLALLAVTSRVARGGLGVAERVATPERVDVVVIAGAAACLVVSQFVTYRGVEVGQPDYAAVSNIAPAPQTDRIDAGAAHAYVLVPLAVIAVALAVVALVTGRWRLGRLVSAVGLVGIAISLAIDMPKGLDAGTAGSAFAGAHATLTEGFYAQLAASAVLVLLGIVLSLNLRRRDRAAVPSPAPRRRPRARRAPSPAEGGA
jgi:hypothetical protein